MLNITSVNRIGKCFLFGILIILTGCINNTTGDPTTRAKHFDLSAPVVNAISKSKDNQVFIMKPKVNHALSKKKITVVTNGNQISYFKDWFWSDDLSSLVQAKIVEVFENKNYFEGVGTLGQGVSTDYRIVTEIRAFQFEVRELGARTSGCLEYSDLSLTSQGEENSSKKEMEFWAIAKISVKIIHERKGKVKASNTYCSETIVDSKKVDKVVDRLNVVLGQVLKQISQDTVTEIRSHREELKKKEDE